MTFFDLHSLLICMLGCPSHAGSGLSQCHTVQPLHTPDEITESHHCPIPQPGENPLGLSEVKAILRQLCISPQSQ